MGQEIEMRVVLSVLVAYLATVAARAEPISGWLTGQENDFLQFVCDPLLDGTKECTFTQVTMRPKLDADEVEALIRERLPDAMADLTGADSEATCTYFAGLEQTIRAALNGDLDAARAHVAEMPDEARAEFDFEVFAKEMEGMDPRQGADILQGFTAMSAACNDPGEDSVEALLRQQLELEARTCKLFLNSWKDTFKQVSDKVWSLADSSAKGQCAVSRLDRFECDGPYSCAYIAEKRVLNKEGKGVIPCRELEETAFRYEHSEPIYLGCGIMSWF